MGNQGQESQAPSAAAEGLRPEKLPPGVRLVPVSEGLKVEAAARLISASVADPYLAAARFLDSARHLGLDLSLMWATVGPANEGEAADGPERVRQVCLAVMGAGRTVMLFVSNGIGPKGGKASRLGASGGDGSGHAERVELIGRACAAACSERALGVGRGKPPAVLAQALLEAAERDALSAFESAGFRRLGDLAYLRWNGVQRGDTNAQSVAAAFPGVRVETLAELAAAGGTAAQIDEMLLKALEGSYVDTLDCPELCGMRSAADVLESHRAVGRFDAGLWWVVSDEVGPQGCMLLSPCPEQESVELVYLGLSPRLRGRGLGSRLLSMGLARVRELGRGRSPAVNARGGVTCAVDMRNGPALKLYGRAGFAQFGVRVPVVRAAAG